MAGGVASLVASVCLLDAAASVACFDYFEYRGNDDIFEWSLPPQSYRNPIISGFAPDPSVCKVGEWVYLVNSSFSWFPGVPIYRSKDLVHWESLGHVIDRPEQVSFEGLQVSEGIFAPTIDYHDGVFYMVTTAVNAGGNFFVTARDPAGPWSNPVWLPEVDGIDPSFFFDDNGKAWLVNNGPPPGDQKYPGHRAIWIQEFDAATQKLVGDRHVLIDGGVNIEEKPVWIEGPHIFKHNNWYYLSCAEGGTAEDHRQVVFRSRDVLGPWEAWDHNPILTQRDLDPSRPQPVTSVGHADLIKMGDDDWWVVFLGCRPYKDGLYYNTGRETFLLPVEWVDGWPLVLPSGQPVPTVVAAPSLIDDSVLAKQEPNTGNFTHREDFRSPTLSHGWSFLRTKGDWWRLEDGSLLIEARSIALDSLGQPSFIARRIQHANFTADVGLQIPEAGSSAGLAVFQKETHHFYTGVRRAGDQVEVFLEMASNDAPQVIAQTFIPSPPDGISLRIEGKGETYAFLFSTDGEAWNSLHENADGTILSTRAAGGFVGAHIGMHARID